MHNLQSLTATASQPTPTSSAPARRRRPPPHPRHVTARRSDHIGSTELGTVHISVHAPHAPPFHNLCHQLWINIVVGDGQERAGPVEPGIYHGSHRTHCRWLVGLTDRRPYISRSYCSRSLGCICQLFTRLPAPRCCQGRSLHVHDDCGYFSAITIVIITSFSRSLASPLQSTFESGDNQSTQS